MKLLTNRKGYTVFLVEAADEVTPEVTTPEEPATPESTVNVQEGEAAQQEPAAAKPEVTAPEATVDIASLEAEIAKIKAENEKLKNQITSKGQEAADNLTKVQADLEAIKTGKEAAEAKTAEYEKVLSDMVEAKLADVPDNIKALMPTAATVTEQLEWIAKAEESGIIKKQIEIGKPMNPSQAKDFIDTTGLSVAQKMAMAYGSRK